MVKFPTSIPDHFGDKFNILFLFLFYNSSPYSIKLFSPLGSSSYLPISVNNSLQVFIWKTFDYLIWPNLQSYYFEFNWNDYRFSWRNSKECTKAKPM